MATAKAPKTVKMYRDDPYFVRCCEAAEIQPTKRQFKKYIDQKGTAFNKGRPIVQYADENITTIERAKEVLNA
jgi:hypothetical protein